MHPYLVEVLAAEKRRDLLCQAARHNSASPAQTRRLRRLGWRRRRSVKAPPVVDVRISCPSLTLTS